MKSPSFLLVQPHQPIRVVHRVVPRVVEVIVIIVLDDRPVQTVVFVVHPLPVPVQRRRQPVPAVVAVARQRLRCGFQVLNNTGEFTR